MKKHRTVEEVARSMTREQIRDITKLLQAPRHEQERIMEKMPTSMLKALVELLEAEGNRRGTEVPR